jgi:uncharacterized protein YqgV (UPF0045/DUF77 family)
MVFTVTMFPVGDGVSILEPVTEVVDEIDRAGLPYQVTAGDTVIEGEWDDVLPVLRRAERRLRERHSRVFMLLTLDDRAGAGGRLQEAVEEVAGALHRVHVDRPPARTGLPGARQGRWRVPWR